jgi:drug/metabolite transporter (DMT)-like permease
VTPATSRAGLLYLAAAAILLGASWPLTRFAFLQGAGAAWFAFGRAGFSAIVSTLLLLVMGRLHRPGRRDLPALLAIGLLQLAGFFAFSHAALAWVPAGRTALLANCTIVFTVPLSLLVLHETISRRRWIAAGLGLAGIAVLTGPWSIDWAAPHLLTGHAELMGASLCWALAMLIVRRFPPAMSMLELLPWSFGLATLALAPITLGHDPGVWPRAALVPLLLVGLLIAPTGTWCIMQAQAMLPLVVASVGFLAGPALGVILASLFLGEALGPDMLLGAGLILAAAAVAATKGRSA